MRSEMSDWPSWFNVFIMNAWASVDAWKLTKSSDEILPKFDEDDISDFGVEHRFWPEVDEADEDIDDKSADRSDRELEQLLRGDWHWPSSDLV